MSKVRDLEAESRNSPNPKGYNPKRPRRLNSFAYFQAASKKSKHIEEKDGKIDTKQGLLCRILHCDRFFITYSWYKLNECVVDFSKPQNSPDKPRGNKKNPDSGLAHRKTLWNNKLRTYLSFIDIGTLTAAMDAYNFDTTYLCIELMMKYHFFPIKTFRLLARDQKGQNENAVSKLKGMQADFKNLGGFLGIKKFLDAKIREFSSVERQSKHRWTFQYNVSNVIIFMTKRDKVFLKAKLSGFIGEHIFQNNAADISIKIKKIHVIDCETKDEKEKLVIKRVSDTEDDTYTMIITQRYFHVTG